MPRSTVSSPHRISEPQTARSTSGASRSPRATTSSEAPHLSAMRRAVIVNADDFGQSAGINRGIIEAHERGIVTSASLMVRWPAAPAAAAYACAHRGLSVGLHVDLGE